MGSLSYDCPHCMTRSSFFKTHFANRENDFLNWSLYGVCEICCRGVVFHLMAIAMQGPSPDGANHKSFGTADQPFTVLYTSPLGPKTFPIDNLPAEIARPYNEAELCLAAENLSAAAVMYRKCIERSVRLIDPEGQGMLNQRIRGLEARNALPHALIQLLDQVKFLGNDAAHDDEDPDLTQVERGRDFTQLFLTYIWDLPARIDAAIAERHKGT